MAVYTIRIGTVDRLFNAEDIEDARKIAKSRGWNPENIVAGDWIRYPETGYPRLGTEEREAYEEPIYDIDYSRATPVSELPPATGEERFGAIEAPPPTSDEHTQEQIDDYDAYLEFLKTKEGSYWPTPKDIDDFLTNWTSWSREKEREFAIWMDYFNAYGKTGDWRPVDKDDYFANYDKAQGFLTLWQQKAQEKEADYTDEQKHDYYQYKDYRDKFSELGDKTALDIADYFENYNQYQQQLVGWQQQEAEVSEHELSPEEKAQREAQRWEREQLGWERSDYAAKEAYRETPMYGETFTAWLGEQGQFSGALEKYTESRYPSLRSRFEAGMPRQTGFPTREEARSEAAKRERGFQAWLSGETPGIYQDYMSQRPAERGERLWMQAPNVRGLKW